MENMENRTADSNPLVDTLTRCQQENTRLVLENRELRQQAAPRPATKLTPTMVDWHLVLIAWVAFKWSATGAIKKSTLVALLYMLKTLRQVHLPYRFTLYSYGPYDNDVDFDIGVAGNLGLIERRWAVTDSQAKPSKETWDWVVLCTASAESLVAAGGGMLQDIMEDVEWAIKTFAGPMNMVLAATVVYADQESYRGHELNTTDTLAEEVAAVLCMRNRLPEIQDMVQHLSDRGLLRSLAPVPGVAPDWLLQTMAEASERVSQGDLAKRSEELNAIIEINRREAGETTPRAGWISVNNPGAMKLQCGHCGLPVPVELRVRDGDIQIRRQLLGGKE